MKGKYSRVRRLVAILTTLVFVFTVSISSLASAAAGDKITVILNGQKLQFSDAEPYIKEGRTLVPFRAIFQAFGMDVQWDGVMRTVYAKNDRTSITLMIDSTVAYVNSFTNTLDVAPEISGSRTYVPLRFISSSVGADVKWDGESRTVTITYSAGKAAIGQTGDFNGVKFSVDKVELKSEDSTVYVSGKISSIDKRIYVYIHETADKYVLAKGFAGDKVGDMYNFEASSYVSDKNFKIKYIEFGVLDQNKQFVKMGDYTMH